MLITFDNLYGKTANSQNNSTYRSPVDYTHDWSMVTPSVLNEHQRVLDGLLNTIHIPSVMLQDDAEHNRDMVTEYYESITQ